MYKQSGKKKKRLYLFPAWQSTFLLVFYVWSESQRHQNYVLYSCIYIYPNKDIKRYSEFPWLLGRHKNTDTFTKKCKSLVSLYHCLAWNIVSQKYLNLSWSFRNPYLLKLLPHGLFPWNLKKTVGNPTLPHCFLFTLCQKIGANGYFCLDNLNIHLYY